jgi:glycosyltransferase involved in cell wall biosynthesis
MAKAPHKILFYTDTPLYGGAEKQLLLLAKNLNIQEFEPIIVCRQSETLKNWYEEINKAEIKLIIIPSPSKNSPSNLWKLSKILKTEKPAIIHAQIWNPVASKYAFLAAKLSKIPLIITEHDPFPLSGHQKLYKKLSLKIPTKIITVSKANQKLMAELYPAHQTKLETVYNGIEKPPQPLSDSRYLHIKKDLFHAGLATKIIFSAGTLHPRKGYKLLISAFKKIINKFDNLKLVIAGEGPERTNLEKLIKNLDLDKKVVLLGQCNNVAELMQASDIFVLPSLKEAFGLAILEAMQNGLPIIASRVGGIPEIISSEKLGILIEAGDKNSLIKALSKLLSNQNLHQQLKQAGLHHWQTFSAQKMVSETAKIYRQIINNTHEN